MKISKICLGTIISLDETDIIELLTEGGRREPEMQVAGPVPMNTLFGSGGDAAALSQRRFDAHDAALDTALCSNLPASLTRSFDDYEALESGEAREYIPKTVLEAPPSWCLCRVARENKVEFSMTMEKGKADRGFTLSAKRVGDDFYISR